MKTKEEIEKQIAELLGKFSNIVKEKNLMDTDIIYYVKKISDLIPTLNPMKIDEERFKTIYNKTGAQGFECSFTKDAVKQYNSTCKDHQVLQPLPSEPPSWFHKEFHNSSTNEFWKLLKQHYGTPTKKELVSVEELEAHPEHMKAGDKRVLINGFPLMVDFRIVAEDYYQRHFNPSQSSEWWMDLKEGDKFMYNGEVKIIYFVYNRPQFRLEGGESIYVDHCTPYHEPSIYDKFMASLSDESKKLYEQLKEVKCPS